MTEKEFLKRLGGLLACLPADQIAESQEFYAEAIADRMEDGMTEEEAVAAMGAPGVVAEAILDDLPAVPRAIAKTRRRSTALLWVLAIVGSPIWAALGLGFLAVAVTVYICIWILAVCVWIVALALVGIAIAMFIFAFDGLLVGYLPYVVVSCGVALAALGLGLLVGAGAWAVSKQIARLSALWVKKALSPFKKDRSNGGGGLTAAGSPRDPRAASHDASEAVRLASALNA